MMHDDRAWLIANLATFPVEALRDFERVLPGDIDKCRRAGEHALAGRLGNVLDESRRLIQAIERVEAEAAARAVTA